MQVTDYTFNLLVRLQSGECIREHSREWFRASATCACAEVRVSVNTQRKTSAQPAPSLKWLSRTTVLKESNPYQKRLFGH